LIAQRRALGQLEIHGGAEREFVGTVVGQHSADKSQQDGHSNHMLFWFCSDAWEKNSFGSSLNITHSSGSTNKIQLIIMTSVVQVQLHDAITSGRSELVRRALAEGADAEALLTASRLTPLAAATELALVSVFDALLAASANADSRAGALSALDVACRDGLVLFARRLVRAGARASPATLTLALQRASNEPVLDLLLRELRCAPDEAALDAALAARSEAYVARLVSAGARATPAQLLAAVRAKVPPALLATLLAATDAPLPRGLLCEAVRNGGGGDDDALAGVLLAGAAVDVDERDDGGATPLALAVERGRVELARTLLRRGADATPAIARAPTAELVDLLVAAGADVNARDEHGATPLSCAVRRQCVDVADALLRHGADVNAGSLSPLTAAFHSVWYQPTLMSAFVTRLITNHGCSVNGSGGDDDDGDGDASSLPLRALLKHGVRQKSFDLMLFAGARLALHSQLAFTSISELVNERPHRDDDWLLASRRAHMRRRRIAALRRPVLEMCIAMRHVSALELVLVLEHLVPVCRQFPFALKWELVSFVKHFNQR
jgi:hypothetical protein